MCVGRVDGSDDNVIVVSSFTGHLRVYEPRRAPLDVSNGIHDASDNDSGDNGSSEIVAPSSIEVLPEHLLLEVQLEQPVLQVDFGRFVSQRPEVAALAVLHPHKLVVYTVDLVLPSRPGKKRSEPMWRNEVANAQPFSMPGAPSYHTLSRVYEHSFDPHTSACSLTIGPFGRVQVTAKTKTSK